MSPAELEAFVRGWLARAQMDFATRRRMQRHGLLDTQCTMDYNEKIEMDLALSLATTRPEFLPKPNVKDHRYYREWLGSTERTVRRRTNEILLGLPEVQMVLAQAEERGFTLDMLRSQRRFGHIREVRRQVYAGLRAAGLSWVEIGQLMHRDHGTILTVATGRRRSRTSMEDGYDPTGS